jgi:hypothetical protein
MKRKVCAVEPQEKISTSDLIASKVGRLIRNEFGNMWEKAVREMLIFMRSD